MNASHLLATRLDENDELIASQILSLARNLDSGATIERSVKLTTGRVDWGRFLVAVDANATSKAQVMGAIETLKIPADLATGFSDAYDNPSAIAFGFESQPGRTVLKVYLEFWEQIVAQVKSSKTPKAPRVLNVGFKWEADDPARSAITEYTCYPLLTPAEILARIRPMIDQVSPGSFDAIQGIITTASRRLRTPSFPYMEASEDNGRTSFDVNLYPARLDVGDISDGIAAIATLCGTAREAVPGFQQHKYRELGHVSGGIGRDGEPFTTIYFGV